MRGFAEREGVLSERVEKAGRPRECCQTEAVLRRKGGFYRLKPRKTARSAGGGCGRRRGKKFARFENFFIKNGKTAIKTA